MIEDELLNLFDPCRILERAQIIADPWQANVLRSSAKRILMCCSRQSGKSTVAACAALHAALYKAGSLVLLVSPSMRQSTELFRKVMDLWRFQGEAIPTEAQSLLRLELLNKSRIISLPGMDSGTIRGFSGVELVVIDESAHVSDSLYASLRPMLAVSQGRLMALGTPFGTRGWFFNAWHSSEEWHRVRVDADQCPRITPEFLLEERQSLGEAFFLQEYFNEFIDDSAAVFDIIGLQDALVDMPPLEV